MIQSWSVVDAYLNGVLLPDDPSGQAALEANAAAGLPAIDVTPNQGRLLQLVVMISGARRVLEIGTLGGYSTLWISRGCAKAARSLAWKSTRSTPGLPAPIWMPPGSAIE